MNCLTIVAGLVLSIIGWTALAQTPATPDRIALVLAEAGVSTQELRTTTSLMENWKFIQDDNLTDEEALAANGAQWATISLPHTWNAEAATTARTGAYKRGLGWYRLDFRAPKEGVRKWLEFGAASLVADVWLNGQKLGQHSGGFTQFRFDVTDSLLPNGKNVLLVKVDNSQPTSDQDRTAIPPLGGDFVIYGGLYRHVSLVSTAEAVHFDLGDMGGPGVYATTASISGGNAAVTVSAKLASNAKAQANYLVRVSLLGADGRVAQSVASNEALSPGGTRTVTHELVVNQPRLWQGVEDPYQYKLVAELLTHDGRTIDRVVQDFGIRQMHFDPAKGFFLNGKHVALRGVATHQEAYGNGWAQSARDIDEKLALVKEIGANTIRLGHYPFGRYTLESLNRLGMVAWAELPVGIGVTTEVKISLASDEPKCPKADASDLFRASARQQLQEMIRQQFNHAAVVMWSLGNETTFLHKDCVGPRYDNLTQVFQELQATAKREDPYRPTTYADFTAEAEPPVNGSYIDLGGITDLWAQNDYPLWYGGPPSSLVALLDALRVRYPNQPIGISEYGAGAAITHHTDNVLGGPPEVNNPGLPVVYQPEEYASYVHEQAYAMILSRNYLYATYVWNMFDFASDLRNEGDVYGVNTKGLVTLDRKTRKDPFYFYKAHWSSEPVIYIAGRRYTNRSYAVADIKIYSNTDLVQLSINDRLVGSMTQDQCLLRTCVFKNVKLDQGENRIAAVGRRGGGSVRDLVNWSLGTSSVNIAAGQLRTGFTSSREPVVGAAENSTRPTTTGSTSVSILGELYGSDNFFTGGEGGSVILQNSRYLDDTTPVRGTEDPQLFTNFRRGRFSYFIPLADGTYSITLGFLEPHRTTSIGQNVFDVMANGDPKLHNFDVLQATNGEYRKVVVKTFTSLVTGGHLKLDFEPAIGNAIVSNIRIQRQ